MFKLTEEQVEKAAEWWADRVCAPVFDGLSDEERKDSVNDTYQIVEFLASTFVESVDNDQRRRFVVALKEELQDPEYNPWWGLGVDYHPDRYLASAAEKAGISDHNFPWKTHLGFTEDGKVTASLGYGNPSEVI